MGSFRLQVLKTDVHRYKGRTDRDIRASKTERSREAQLHDHSSRNVWDRLSSIGFMMKLSTVLGWLSIKPSAGMITAAA